MNSTPPSFSPPPGNGKGDRAHRRRWSSRDVLKDQAALEEVTHADHQSDGRQWRSEAPSDWRLFRE